MLGNVVLTCLLQIGALPVENCPVQQLFICCTGWGVVVEFHQCRELILYDLRYQD